MDQATTIHGENAVSLASIMEYLQQPNHPFYETAKKMADVFMENQRDARREISKQRMQEQMHYISEEEWSAIVD